MTVLESIFAYLAAIPTELPAIGDSDSGKVLTVSNDLEAGWAALPD